VRFITQDVEKTNNINGLIFLLGLNLDEFHGAKHCQVGKIKITTIILKDRYKSQPYKIGHA